MRFGIKVLHRVTRCYTGSTIIASNLSQCLTQGNKVLHRVNDYCCVSLPAVRFGNKVLRSDSIAILRERRKNEPIESESCDNENVM